MNQKETTAIAKAAVCSAFGVTEADITRRDRHRNIADARMALCLLLAEQGIAPETVADTVQRTKTDVLHAARAMAAVAETDRTLAAALEACRSVIANADITDEVADALADKWQGGELSTADIDRAYTNGGVTNLIACRATIYADEAYHGQADYDTPPYTERTVTANIEPEETVATDECGTPCQPTVFVDWDAAERKLEQLLNC